MKKSIFVSKLVSAIFVTILLTRSMIITPSPKIIFVPFLICSISMAMEQIGLILNKRKFAMIFHKLFIIGFFLFWFGVLIVGACVCLREQNYGLLLFTIPFWLIGIHIIKRQLLNMKPKTKAVSNLNFMVIIGAGLVGIVLLSGLIILVLGIIRAETFIIFFGGFFVFGGLAFVLGALNIMGRFDKYRIDVLGLYVGILFVVIGIGFPVIKCREMQSLSETIQAFGFWILIPIMMTVVGVLQIVKCLKNRG